MIWLCGVALGGSALLLLRYYFAYLRARLDECLGFLSLLSELKRGISLRLESPSSVALRLSEPRLAPSGFNSALENGASLSEAFEAVRERLLIPQEAGRILGEYFDCVGEGYLDAELRSLEGAISALEPIAVRERDGINQRCRLAGVLTFSALAGALLLLM